MMTDKMTALMYEYIKGQKVQMEEHMLSATELASMYRLETLKHKPNAILVGLILSDYVKDTNLNIAEYYYPHKKGVMRVYPEVLYRKALEEFVFDLEPFKQKVYISRYEKRKVKFIYAKFEELKEPVVIPIGMHTRFNTNFDTRKENNNGRQ